MGANANTFLHLRDAEMNAEMNHIEQPKYSAIDMATLYRTSSGKVVMVKQKRGRVIWCRYPNSDNIYPFNKNDLNLIYNQEEKVKEFKLFK